MLVLVVVVVGGVQTEVQEMVPVQVVQVVRRLH